MKKVLCLILLMCFVSLPVYAKYTNAYPLQQTNSSNSTKIYDEHGSYQQTHKLQSNGNIKVYGKYGQYKGVYKKSSGKIKYYPKK